MNAVPTSGNKRVCAVRHAPALNHSDGLSRTNANMSPIWWPCTSVMRIRVPLATDTARPS